jgi:hypothetical protein
LLVLGRLGSLRHSDLIEGNLCGAEMEIASRCGVAREIAPCPGAWRPAFRFCSSAQRTPLTAIATSLAGGEKGGKPFIPRQLARGGSRGAVRSPAPGSPGPPRSEPSTRGSFRKRADYSNLNRRPARIPV